MSFPHEFSNSNPLPKNGSNLILKSDLNVNDPGPTNCELPDSSTGSDSTSTTHPPALTESQADSIVIVNVRAPAVAGRSSESVASSNTIILSSSPTPSVSTPVTDRKAATKRIYLNDEDKLFLIQLCVSNQAKYSLKKGVNFGF